MPKRRYLIALVLFLGVFLATVLTASHYGLAWDEPYYFHSSDLQMEWGGKLVKNLVNLEPNKSLSDDTVTRYWHWDPYHVPHPPFSRILSGVSKTLFSPFMDAFVAYRLSTAFLFSLLIGVLYLWIAEVWSGKTGIFAALSLFFMPHVFGHAHFAMTDIPLTCMWFLSVYCFYKGLNHWRWSLLFGVILGLSFSTKFPAFLIPIPLLIWSLIWHRNRCQNNLFSMIFIAPPVMVLTQPYLWHHTLPRILEFILNSVTRGENPDTSFVTLFFGKLLLSHQLPWYYPYFIVAISIPVGILAFSLLGMVFSFGKGGRDGITILFSVNALFILSLPLFPGAVIHDGTRLLLPAFPFLAGLGGIGFHGLLSVMKRYWHRRPFHGVRKMRLKAAVFLMMLTFVPALGEMAAIHPYELSYYNSLIGGLEGAYKSGLEVTYLQEAINPRFLSYLDREIPENSMVNGSFSNFMLDFYQKRGRLRRDIKLTDKRDCDFYILLSRKTAFSDFDRWLLKKKPTPTAAVKLRGVPLISIYKFAGNARSNNVK